MDEPRRALVICAHDDDEVMGPGATIRKLANSGVRVSTLIFATGNEGYTRLHEKDTIVARRAEERAAARRILGTAECSVCDFHDFENLDSEPVYRTIMETVRRVQPHLVFTHLATDYLAHRTLARVAPEAIWQAGWQCSLELGEPWPVNKLYQFSVLELIAKPSHVVDITDTFGAKLEAMQAHASQHEVVAGVLKQVEAKALAYGSLIGVRHAEAFVRSQFIPVPVGDPSALLTGL
jgi:LmbE family N-acetylglucosaminyl deacetylase